MTAIRFAFLTGGWASYADGPALMIGSQRPQAVGDPRSSTVIYRMLLSTGAITSAETYTAESPFGNVHRTLHVGGVTSAAASSGGLIGGDISMWMIFSRALHLDLPLRDLAIRVVRARYAIPVAA